MGTKDRRLALIVASSQFTDETLQQLVAPGQDAADLARVLEDPTIGGFEVKQLTNWPSHEVCREIEAFFALRKRNDLLLLYFSGHGVKDDDGRLYLAATDTQRGLFRTTAVPAALVNEIMTASRSHRQVLILDCCHSGAFARGMVAKGGESVDIRDRFEGRGRVVLTASNATQYAFQGDEIIGEGSGSVFTHYLVRGLETGEADRDGDGWISLDELYDYVYDRVADERLQQTPGKWVFDLHGDIFIARSPLGKRKPAVEEARLAAQYAEAVGFLEAGEWQKALDKLDEVRDVEPEYPDRQELVAKAKKGLAWQRALRWLRVAAVGGVISLVAVGGIFMVGPGRKVKSTPTVEQAIISAVASPTSSPVPATPTPPPPTATPVSLTASATPTATNTPTQTPAPPTATATDTPSPTATLPPTATDTPSPPTPIPIPTVIPQPALTIYLRDTLTETGFAALSGDQPNGGMIYKEGKFVYGHAAVQVGEMTYPFDKETGPGDLEQLPDPWRVEFEFDQLLVARTGHQAGSDPKKARFWVGTLDSDSAVGEDNPYRLTMRLYEGNELRESIQVSFTVADAPESGGGPGGKPDPS